MRPAVRPHSVANGPMASPRLSSWEVAYKTNWVWCPSDSRQSSVCPFSRVLPYAKACPLSHSAPLACAALRCRRRSLPTRQALARLMSLCSSSLPPPVKVKAPIVSLVPVDFQCWEPQSPFHIPGMNENVERRFPRASQFSGGTFPEMCGKKNDQSRRRRREDKKSAGRGAWNGEAGRRNLDSGAGAGGFWLG